MEEEKAADNIQAQSGSPVPSSLPINWGLITGPVPEPVFPAPSLNTQLPPSPSASQSSAVHALQSKVKSLTQRRTRGRERERLDTDAAVSSPVGHISSEVLLRPRPRGKCQTSLPAPSWRSGAAKVLSSSDEEEEVEVQVKLEIHSPPPGAKGEELIQGGEETEEERSERNESQVSFRPYGLGEGTSLESLLSDNSSSSKDEPSPPPPPPLSSSPATTSASATSSTSSSSSSTRRWAPPKGFWRVARPETLLLNGVCPNNLPSTIPLRDYTQTEAPIESKQEDSGTRSNVGIAVDDCVVPPEFKHSDSVECFLDRCEKKETETLGLCSSDSWESMPSQTVVLSAEEKLKAKQRAYEKLRERKQTCMVEREQSGGEGAENYEDSTYSVEGAADIGHHGSSDSSVSAILTQELEPYLRSLLIISDELPLSPRHEQAKRLLERARLKARSNHVKGDRPFRRSHTDQRSPVKKQPVELPNPTAVQKLVQTKEDVTPQTVTVPLLVPNQREASPGDNGVRSRRYGCSPTRVRFEDESEKEAESRYLDRMRQRGRPGTPKSKNKESNTDSSSSGSEKGRGQRNVSMPPLQKPEEVGTSVEPTTVIKEIIVLVKKCEACGSVVREPQTVPSSLDSQRPELQLQGNPEDTRGGKAVPHWMQPSKLEASTRPKAPLTVTFAGAYVLGESKESSTGWKSSGFGKLRRRSRKGESRAESGNGPYGQSWAQRRNSNPRSRVNMSRVVSFAPGSPIALEPRLLEASGGLPPAPSLPIKSALKSSSRNRSAAGQTTVQFQITSDQECEGETQLSALLDSPETRRESLMALTQVTPTTSSPMPCIRPSTLRYSPIRITTDLPSAELWDATPDGSGTDCFFSLQVTCPFHISATEYVQLRMSGTASLNIVLSLYVK
ncbi:uncharacterized protein LOC121520554 [Cheilinus undulatus]|uniref:uncharacterized protein LOC121520554 n=1 Tax=Cheilinus undulatus TaxID=241271 RepID=UPI001BD267F2|nr:uncharacterized protein LOC121520554 [Cheilinus undulatus]